MNRRFCVGAAGALLLVALFLAACSGSQPQSTTTQPPQSAATRQARSTPTQPPVGTPGQSALLGTRTKTSGCQANGPLPDRACTPGAIFPDATKEMICRPGYSRGVRNVPQSLKDEAYAEYGIKSHQPGEYEVDHLISLELGGSNDIANLWPEAAEPRPGFHEKDQVENYLHDQVCSGAKSLQEAQQEIATDWVAVYKGMPKEG